MSYELEDHYAEWLMELDVERHAPEKEVTVWKFA
jgi:hypothetical protein